MVVGDDAGVRLRQRRGAVVQGGELCVHLLGRGLAIQALERTGEPALQLLAGHLLHVDDVVQVLHGRRFGVRVDRIGVTAAQHRVALAVVGRTIPGGLEPADAVGHAIPDDLLHLGVEPIGVPGRLEDRLQVLGEGVHLVVQRVQRRHEGRYVELWGLIGHPRDEGVHDRPDFRHL